MLNIRVIVLLLVCVVSGRGHCSGKSDTVSNSIRPYYFTLGIGAGTNFTGPEYKLGLGVTRLANKLSFSGFLGFHHRIRNSGQLEGVALYDDGQGGAEEEYTYKIQDAFQGFYLDLGMSYSFGGLQEKVFITPELVYAISGGRSKRSWQYINEPSVEWEPRLDPAPAFHNHEIQLGVRITHHKLKNISFLVAYRRFAHYNWGFLSLLTNPPWEEYQSLQFVIRIQPTFGYL